MSIAGDAIIQFHGPQHDFHLRQMRLNDSQRARRVADIAEVQDVPRGLLHTFFGLKTEPPGAA